jgi:hypothetical protein
MRTTLIEVVRATVRGFRLVAAPQTVAPGEEVETCISWPFPAKLASNIVYAGRLYTTPDLHHSKERLVRPL